MIMSDKNILTTFESFDDTWKDDSSALTAQVDASKGNRIKLKSEISFGNNSDITDERTNHSKTTKSKVKSTTTPLTKSEKKLLDDERRRKSMFERIAQRKNQQAIISSALSNLNGSCKRIVFDDDDSDITSSKTATKLFDSDDETNEPIEIKERYSGEKGLKLLKLQSNYLNDERFKLDERFLEDDTSEKEREPKKQILFMQRYDLSQNSCSANAQKKTQDSKSKRGKVSSPIVSKEKFYNMTEKFNTLTSDTGFSVLQMYSNNETSKDEPHHPSDSELKQIQRRNPFVNDDFSDEDLNEEVAEPESRRYETPPVTSTRESFFYSANDTRLKDGFEFINKKDSEEANHTAENYDSIRRLLKKVVRVQVNKRSSKIKMFKRKVGGMKKTTKANGGYTMKGKAGKKVR